MSNRVLNDHSVRRVILSKVLKITAGGFNCWCDSNVGVIRKPNHAVPDFLWDTFFGKEPDPQTIIEKKMTYRLREEKLKWYQKLWLFIKGLFKRI